MVESWMINVATLFAALVASYAVIKYKVDASSKETDSIREDMKEYDTNNIKKYDRLDTKIDAYFKRLDEVSNQVIVLERDTAYHLDMKQAEVKFVTKEQLSLHMKNIDSELAHLNKNGDLMVGKLDDLTKALSEYVLSGKDK